MATTTEVLELILKVSGSTDGSKLEQQLAAIDREAIQAKTKIDLLDQALAKGKINPDAYATAIEKAVGALNATDAARDKMIAGLARQSAAVDRATLKEEAAAIRAAEAAQRSADRATEAAARKAAAAQAAAEKIEAADDKAAIAAQAAADKQAAAAAKAGASVGGGTKQAAQGFLDISRAAQDFAQGGFGGIINNLEGIGRAIPALLKNPMALLSSLPAILTLVGTALYMFGGQVYNAFRHFLMGSNDIPKATTELGKVEARIKEVNKQLEEYQKAQKLTNAELVDYNKLSAEQVVLERQKTEQMEIQTQAKKFATENLKKEAEEQSRAALFQQTLGAPKEREQLVESIKKAMPQETRDTAAANLQRAIRAKEDFERAHEGDQSMQVAGARTGYVEAINKARAGLELENKQRTVQAKMLAEAAVTGGDAGAAARILALQKQAPGAFTDIQKFAFTEADPKARAREQRQIEADQHQRQLAFDIQEANRKRNDDAIAASVKPIEAAQRVTIDRIKDRGDIKVESDRLFQEAKAQGLKDAEEYEHVWRGIYAFLRTQLLKQGVQGGGEQVAAAAQQIAGAAPGAFEQRRQVKIDRDLATAQAETDRERKKWADAKSDLMAGIGDQGMAGLERQQMMINAIPVEAQRKRAQAGFERATKLGGFQQLVGEGVEPRRAEELAGLIPQLVQSELAKEMVRAKVANADTMGPALRGMGKQVQNQAIMMAVDEQLMARMGMLEQEMIAQGQQAGANLQKATPRGRGLVNRGRQAGN